MALQNRETATQDTSDFINRVAPYNGNALIQKTEDNEIRAKDKNNVVFKVPQVKAINNPAAAFNVDFGEISNVFYDEYEIDSSSSVPTDFIITIQNLEGNSVGKLSIVKKAGQTYDFSNVVIITRDGTVDQDGKNSLQFNLTVVNGTIYATPLYELKKALKIASSVQLLTKVIEIGVWDMDAGASVSVDSGLDDQTKIRSMSAIIRIDSNVSSGNILFPLNSIDSGTGLPNGGVSNVGNIPSNPSYITLFRVTGKDFDSASFDEVGVYNRGWVTIIYEE